jgi:hypothetical protein
MVPSQGSDTSKQASEVLQSAPLLSLTTPLFHGLRVRRGCGLVAAC